LVANSKRRRAELLLSSANITAIWEDPPTAEKIRTRDQERLLEDERLIAAPDASELPLAQALLARQSPETIAAALIRLYRAGLPEPAEITIQQAFAPARPARTPPAPTPFVRNNGAMSWFRANVGRRNNADPKWLIPLICRLGDVTKQDIGVIRIFDRETKFEITAAAVTKFTAAIAKAGPEDLAMEPSTAPGPGPARDPGPRPPKSPEQARRRKNKANKQIS